MLARNGYGRGSRFFCRGHPSPGDGAKREALACAQRTMTKVTVVIGRDFPGQARGYMVRCAVRLGVGSLSQRSRNSEARGEWQFFRANGEIDGINAGAKRRVRPGNAHPGPLVRIYFHALVPCSTRNYGWNRALAERHRKIYYLDLAAGRWFFLPARRC